MRTGILFDLDGTLLDTLEDLTDAVNYVLRQFGYPERTIEEVRRFVGNGARVLIQRAVPEGVDPETVFAAFRSYYDAHCQEKTRPYAGVMAALTRLGGMYPIAVVSNKPDSAVKALCAYYFPGVYALGESADCPRKPAPDMIKKAMDAIGVDQCVYVGDSEVDVATARNAGVPCLTVLWGFRDKEELEHAGATNFCTHPAQIVDAVVWMIAGST
jgi:phosphoglycolate phosphatase